MKTYTFKTGMTVSQDWDRDGCLVIKNAKTLDRYREIHDKRTNYTDPCIFYAFDEAQLKRGMDAARPHLKEGQKIKRGNYGMWATQEAYDKMMEFFANADKMIAEECDPQEVYCYEYNNYESFIAWEGDTEAYNIVRRIYGADVKIHRF